MASHSHGSGITLISLPLPEREARLYGRWACARDKSRVKMIRQLLLAGLRAVNREAAASVREIRRSHRAAKASVLVALTLLAMVHGLDMRRPSRGGRRRQDEVEAAA